MIQRRTLIYAAATAAILIAVVWSVLEQRSDSVPSDAQVTVQFKSSPEVDSQITSPYQEMEIQKKLDLSDSNSKKPTLAQVVAMAERGDAAAQRELSDQYAECSIFINGGESVYRQVLTGIWDATRLDPENRRRAESVLEEQISVCSQLIQYATDVHRDAADWRRLAALGGDNSAIASELILNFDSIERDQRAQLAAAVIRSGDVNAILRISELMHRQIETGDEYLDSISGSPFGYASLAIYACRRGAECGSDSAVMRRYCLHMGLCNYTNLEGALFAEALPVSSRQKLNVAVDNISTILGR